MRRIRKAHEKETVKDFKSHILDTKVKMVGVIVAGAIILVIAFILMFVESGYGKIIIKNNTDLNLDYVTPSFVFTDGDPIELGEIKSINAHQTYSKPLDQVHLLNTEANLEVHFKYADHDELLTDAGIFTTNFAGNIKITYSKTNDPNLIKLKIKASNGIFQTDTVDCDETFLINLSEGKIYED